MRATLASPRLLPGGRPVRNTLRSDRRERGGPGAPGEARMRTRFVVAVSLTLAYLPAAERPASGFP